MTNREQLVNYFAEDQTLIDKPKLLFIHGFQPILYPAIPMSGKEEPDSTVGHSNNFRIPKYADFMVFYSAHVRNSINALCQILDDNAHQYDLMTMLSMVCAQMVPTSKIGRAHV